MSQPLSIGAVHRRCPSVSRGPSAGPRPEAAQALDLPAALLEEHGAAMHP